MAVRTPFPGRTSKTSAHLRGGRVTYDEENNNNNGLLQAPRSKSLDTSPDVRFACPFFKANPREVQANGICARNTWPSISRLKEHLYRRHSQQKLSCSRCFTSFEQDQELEAHLRTERPCKLSDSRDRPTQTISPAQMYKLRRRKGLYGETENQKWFEIWTILFPNKEQPASPYAESREGLWGWDFHMMDGLEEFMKEHIPKNVADGLGRRYFLRTDTTEDDENIQKAIYDGVVAAFQQYKGQLDDQPTPTSWLREQQHQRSPEALETCESSQHPTRSRSRCSQRSRSCSTGRCRSRSRAARQDIPVVSPVDSTPSLTISSCSTAFSDCTDLSGGGRESLLAGLHLTAEPSDMNTSPEQAGLAMWGDTAPLAEFQLLPGMTMGQEQRQKAAAALPAPSDQLDVLMQHLPLETDFPGLEFEVNTSQELQNDWLMAWNDPSCPPG